MQSPFQLFGKAKKIVVKNACCGIEMLVDNSGRYLHCKLCNRLLDFIPSLTEKPESQKTQYDSDGTIYYGKVSIKTPSERVLAIVTEFKQRKIFASICRYLDDQTMYQASLLMYDITKDNTKKKDNRNQLFAACLFLVSANEGYVILVPDLVLMLKLEKDGIKKGIGYVTKYVTRNNRDLIIDPPVHRNYVVKYLGNIRLMDQEYLQGEYDTLDKIRFCSDLVEFMLENSIAYDTKITSKASAAVYYMLIKFNFYNGNKRDISKAIGVGQNTSIITYNALVSNSVQTILPKIFQMDPLSDQISKLTIE